MTFLIYHMVPQNLTGEVLYPLNVLRTHLPEIYDAQVKKYSGREGVMAHKVPILECLWNDVLHFSPVHPSKIRDAIADAGWRWKPKL